MPDTTPTNSSPLPPRGSGARGEGPRSILPLCRQLSTSGPCLYPAASCPRHPRPVEAPNPKSEIENPKSTDPRVLARHVLQLYLAGEASAPEAARFARASHAVVAMGEPPQDREAYWRDAQLRGRIMHGLPPQDEKEWAWAATVYDDEALAEFRRWECMLRGIPPLDKDLDTEAARAFARIFGVVHTPEERYLQRLRDEEAEERARAEATPE